VFWVLFGVLFVFLFVFDLGLGCFLGAFYVFCGCFLVFVNVLNYTYLYLIWVPILVSATSLFCCLFIFLSH
jgi:hypothetical protein